MGCCISSLQTNAVTPSTAKVVSVNGTLRQYSVPVTAAHVLKNETATEEALFVCNSDKLYFDERIPPLDPNDHLQVGQIYFVLPTSKLRYPLTASDMAALAVKASSAINDEGERGSGWWGRRRRKKVQISPLLMEGDEGGSFEDGEFCGGKRLGLARSGSVSKLQRSASRRAKMAYRSFRERLSTINESSVFE